jgi:hypothetical protein
MSDLNYTITTDNEFMTAIGLSSFTIPELYDWVTELDGVNLTFLKIEDTLKDALQKDFNNLTDAQISAGKATAAFPIMKLLLGHHETISTGDPQYHFTTGRRAERGSERVKFTGVVSETHSTWELTFEETDYKVKDLKLDNTDINPSNQNNYIDDAILRLINMNEIVIKSGYLDNADQSKRARSYFIQDIKNSQEQGITWEPPSSSIVFIDINGEEFDCDVPLKFKLCLKGGKAKPKTNRFKSAIPSTNFVSTPQTSTGQQGTVGPDGRPVAASDMEYTNSDGQIAGELSIHYNDITKKFYSGTRQILAVMETDLPAATPPDKGLLEATPDEWMDSKTGFTPTVGKARPITLNGPDPWSWGPSYMSEKSDNSTEEENAAMQSVMVQNKLPDTAFPAGKMVVLQEIEGVWQPLTAGGEGTEDTLTPTKVDNWDFMYLVSNANHYFRHIVGDIKDGNSENIRYGQRETDFHKHYYGDPTVNNLEISSEPNGYVQLTSWDFMGKAVGGLRDAGHALGQTQYSLNTDLEPVENFLGLQSAPFFGCVFPDGYNLGDKYTTYTTKLAAGAGMTVAGNTGVARTQYLNDIAEDTIVFNEADNNNKYHSMFDDISDDTFLSHLPADIALNSNPDSTVGAPLSILQEIEEAFSYGDGTNIQGRINACFDKRHAWLQDADGNSTFEFAPRNKNHVQFRPLKAEVYATFEVEDSSEYSTYYNQKQLRGSFGAESWNMLSAQTESPISTKVLSRVGQGGIFGANGFEYNVDLVYEDATTGKNVSYARNRHDNNIAMPYKYWEAAAGDQATDWRDSKGSKAWAGGGVGIIAASCKVTANTAINFNAQCNIGMNDTIAYIVMGSLTNLGGIAGFGGLAGVVSTNSPLTGTHYYSSFGEGGSLATYHSLNNTTLHARVFHGWPKKQTVYDPRYFAVYHFSAGVGDSAIDRKYYHDGIEIETEPEWQAFKTPELDTNGDPKVPEVLVDAVIDYNEGKYIVDQITYEETDFREPTLADNTSDDGYGVLPKEGDEVWRDVTNSEVVGRNWRDPSDWKVNIEARGKLLPIPENGVPILDIGINQIVLEPNDADSGTSAGEGYEEIDTFTTTGGSGSGVVISCTTNPDDTIKSLTVVHAGNGFLPEDFLDNPAPEAPADPVDPADPVTYSHGEATVKIVPLDVVSGGTGLSAFVKSGIIKNIYKTIAKPVEITALGLVDISVAPRSPNDDDTSNDKAIDEIKTTSVDVTSSPSSNKEYDVFFHFHNDITHTFIDGKWAHNAFGGGPTNEEQAIDLQISAI